MQSVLLCIKAFDLVLKILLGTTTLLHFLFQLLCPLPLAFTFHLRILSLSPAIHQLIFDIPLFFKLQLQTTLQLILTHMFNFSLLLNLSNFFLHFLLGMLELCYMAHEILVSLLLLLQVWFQLGYDIFLFIDICH